METASASGAGEGGDRKPRLSSKSDPGSSAGSTGEGGREYLEVGARSGLSDGLRHADGFNVDCLIESPKTSRLDADLIRTSFGSFGVGLRLVL